MRGHYKCDRHFGKCRSARVPCAPGASSAAFLADEKSHGYCARLNGSSHQHPSIACHRQPGRGFEWMVWQMRPYAHGNKPRGCLCRAVQRAIVLARTSLPALRHDLAFAGPVLTCDTCDCSGRNHSGLPTRRRPRRLNIPSQLSYRLLGTGRICSKRLGAVRTGVFDFRIRSLP